MLEKKKHSNLSQPLKNNEMLKKAYNGNNTEYPNCGKKPHGNKSCASSGKKSKPCCKMGHFAKKCRSPLSNHNTGNSRFNKKVNYHAKSGQHSEGEKGSCQLGIYFASSLVGMAAAWKTVIIDGTEMKMHMDTGADSTMIWSTI